MGRIPEDTINEIRNRVDIVDLIGRYVDLKKAGRNHKGLCPFHNEKTPSFNVNPDRQVFHCFGCEAGGDVIGFLMRHDGLTFPEAARTLAHECGIEIPERHSGGEQGISEKIFAANDVAQELYREALTAADGKVALDYLLLRGLDEESIGRFEIGFAPDAWDAIKGALGRRKIPFEVGEQAGLLSRGRNNSEHFYDKMRGRVVFPIHDVRGRVVGFGGRALGDDEPKYLNTPETPVFRKREAMYGFPKALEPIRRAERAIICEGYFDRIALERAGLGEALATCGTALTQEHGRQLRRRAKLVVLLFDGDEAGQKAIERSLEMLLPEGLRVHAATLPSGEDPDSFLVAHGADALRALVDRAPNALDVVLRRCLAAGCATPGEKSDVVGRIAPLIALIAAPVERGEWARRVAVAVGADAVAVEAAVRQAARGGDASRIEVAVPSVRRRGPEDRQLGQLAQLLVRAPTVSLGRSRVEMEALLPEGNYRDLILGLLDAAHQNLVDASGALDHFRVEADLDEDGKRLFRKVTADDSLLDEGLSTSEVARDLIAWFDRRRRSAAGKMTTQRLRDTDADSATLLIEKQKQLEERRAAHGLESDRSGPVHAETASPPGSESAL